tara:strand:- start:1786 stop:2460 length:675 start_codon:yes stop_codon:yes gene_type:complete
MIIVIGASSGIGKTISNYLIKKGEKIITLSRSKAEFEYHLTCDVTDYNSLKKIYKYLNQNYKNIEAIINCAGIASMNLAVTTPSHITEKIIKTNLIGTIYTNQIFAPLLIKNKYGRIINFSTIAVPLGLQGESIYVASKAGVEAFSKVFAKEMAPFNITVNCIAPGPIRTNLLRGIDEKKIKNILNRQIIKKELQAKDVYDLVEIIINKNASNITGQVFNLGGV